MALIKSAYAPCAMRLLEYKPPLVIPSVEKPCERYLRHRCGAGEGSFLAAKGYSIHSLSPGMDITEEHLTTQRKPNNEANRATSLLCSAQRTCRAILRKNPWLA